MKNNKFYFELLIRKIKEQILDFEIARDFFIDMKCLMQIVGMLDFVILDIGFALREKCPHTEFFLVRIQSECGKIQTRKNSVFGHFSRNVALNSHWL